MKIEPFLKIEKENMDVLHLQWSYKNNLLAFSDFKDKMLSIWDISKKKKVIDFIFQNPINIFRWAFDDQYLFCSESSHIYRVNLKNSEVLEMDLIPQLTNFAFFNSDKAIIGIDSDTLYLIDTSSSNWRVTRKLQLEYNINAFCFNQKRKIVACYYPDNIEVYNMNLELEKRLSNEIFGVTILEWDLEGNSLYIGDYYGNVVQWEINRNEIGYKEKFIDMDKYNDIYYDSSEATLYFNGDKWFPQSLDHYYDPKFEYLLDECINHNYGEPIHDIKFHPLDDYFTITPNLDIISILKYPENRKINEITELKVNSDKIAYSNDGKYIAVSSHKGSIHIWNFKKLLK